tara:strand:- start:173 stop:886 length:714 start_codon:yes stop_codon:yes gene_type:complete
MNLIILAAGRGTRLPKKFRNRPKCLTKIENKTLIDLNLKFYLKFEKKILISGYQSNLLKKKIKKNLFEFIYNKDFRKTNMVHSMFLASKKITNDVVICYGDIIFDKSIFNLLKKKGNIMPVYKDWLKLWKKRMNKKKIKDDAEDIKIKKKELKMIGEKIKLKFPKFQYMGIFKIKREDFFKLKMYYEKLGNKKIDMTNFINSALKQKMIKFDTEIYKKFWFEIDNYNDIKVASNFFK